MCNQNAPPWNSSPFPPIIPDLPRKACFSTPHVPISVRKCSLTPRGLCPSYAFDYK